MRNPLRLLAMGRVDSQVVLIDPRKRAWKNVPHREQSGPIFLMPLFKRRPRCFEPTYN
jgi:hypothetical protein